MGLDMYAYTLSADLIGDAQVDIGMKPFEGKVNSDFAYWRKFNHLHGWMDRLYRMKGGKSEDFNCDTVRLMPEDIDQLEKDFFSDKLTPTAGFFFGECKEMHPEDKESLVKFVANSRAAFDDGLAVIYDSWW